MWFITQSYNKLSIKILLIIIRKPGFCLAACKGPWATVFTLSMLVFKKRETIYAIFAFNDRKSYSLCLKEDGRKVWQKG